MQHELCDLSRLLWTHLPDMQIVVSPCAKSTGSSGTENGCQRSWLGVSSECAGSALAPNLAGSMPSAGLKRELFTEGLIRYSQLLKFCLRMCNAAISPRALWPMVGAQR